jgi:hypothetical protein
MYCFFNLNEKLESVQHIAVLVLDGFISAFGGYDVYNTNSSTMRNKQE